MHTTHVFTGADRPIKQPDREVRWQACPEAEIDNVCWHDLRHTWASTWASWHVMNGMRRDELQELGGWFSYEMAQRCGHLSSERRDEVAKNVAGPQRTGYITI